MTHKAMFITGAAGGIGSATARRFAEAGWQVGLGDRDEAALAPLADELGERARCYAFDVTDAQAFADAVADFAGHCGRLDLMVNNAGVLVTDDFEKIPPSRYEGMVRINVMGVVNGALAALPHLRATPGARMINLSSASAISGTPGYAVYSASKCAVRGLTEALHVEWLRHGIVVADVMPMFVATRLLDGIGNRTSMDRFGVRLGPQDVAAAIWRAAHWPRWWPRVHFGVGREVPLLALAARLLPFWINRWIARLATGY